MKIRTPAILILFTFIACSMPGCTQLTGDSSQIVPDFSSGVQTATITSAVIPDLTPAPVEALPVITNKNVVKLSEVKSASIGNVYRLVWQPDSRILTVINQQEIALYETPGVKKIAAYIIPENTSVLDYDPASHMIALTSDRMKLNIRSIDGTDVQSITPAGGFGSAAFETGGKRIWVSSMDEIKANSFDTATGKQAVSCAGFETAAPVYSASPSPAGNWLVWIARATIQLNHLTGCGQTARIGHEDFISSHAFSADDSMLAVSAGGEVDGQFQPLLYIYNSADGRRLQAIPLNESPAMSLSFSPDTTIIAAAGSGLTLFDMTTGHEVNSLAGPGQRFTAAAFSPDGRLFAASDETSLHIYAISR